MGWRLSQVKSSPPAVSVTRPGTAPASARKPLGRQDTRSSALPSTRWSHPHKSTKSAKINTSNTSSQVKPQYLMSVLCVIWNTDASVERFHCHHHHHRCHYHNYHYCIVNRHNHNSSFYYTFSCSFLAFFRLWILFAVNIMYDYYGHTLSKLTCLSCISSGCAFCVLASTRKLLFQMKYWPCDVCPLILCPRNILLHQIVCNKTWMRTSLLFHHCHCVSVCAQSSDRKSK